MRKLFSCAILAAALALFGVQAASAGTRHDTSPGQRSAVTVAEQDGRAHRSPHHQRTSATDKRFLVSAAQIGLAEIAEGRLASTTTSTPAVHDLAQRMITDHTAQLAKQSPLDAALGVATPTSPNPQQQAELATLSQLAGSGFDQAYCRAQVKGHLKAIGLFLSEIRDGSNRTVRSFARETIPTLVMHLKMARAALATVEPTATSWPVSSHHATTGLTRSVRS